MKRAVIYARVSTDRQADEGLSIDSQIQACRTKAEGLGAAVLHVFRDEGISGTTDARPGFRTAINRCALGDVDYLICWSSSRFARDQHDAISYKRELVSYRTKLIYAQGNIDLESHEGWMLDSFQQVVDESYSRQVSADTKRSMMKAAREGYWMGGHVPFGYQAVAAIDGKRRKLIPIEPDASIVRSIFDSAQRGIGAKLIALDLNAQGLKMRGRPWSKGTILYMLKSEAYMGTVIYNRMHKKTRSPRPEEEWIRVQAHEGLVSAEIFNLVQAGLSGRAPTPETGSPASMHVFTGLLRCGICNSSLQVQTGTGRGAKLYSYYACRGHLQGKRCEFKNVRADKFDPWLLDQLLDKLLSRQTIQAVLDQLDDAAGRWVKDRAARRTALVLELRTAENRRSKLYDVIETGGADAPGVNELGPRIKQLNEQIAKIEAALVSIENEEEPMVGTIEVSAEDAAEIFRATVTQCDDPKILRAFVASIAEMIVVQGTEVIVHYKPECLIQMDGNSVRSEHSWLLDLGSNQGPTD
ncbi:recombinase family protein [Paucibacter sp. Y2R2-4]|uniref:recombinase family protein n=1 Tax=Paucibacter sp. Y2R2-4 TaxID=2893553 RepID=UPI00398C96C5